MELRSQSHLRGKVKSVTRGEVISEVVVDIGGQEVVSVITSSSLDALRLKPGEEVAAVVRSTDIVVGR